MYSCGYVYTAPSVPACGGANGLMTVTTSQGKIVTTGRGGVIASIRCDLVTRRRACNVGDPCGDGMIIVESCTIAPLRS